MWAFGRYPHCLQWEQARHRPDSWSSLRLWRLWSQWVISISQLTHPPWPPRPLLWHSDSWTLVLVSLLVWSLQLQTAVRCHMFCLCLLCPYSNKGCVSGQCQSWDWPYLANAVIMLVTLVLIHYEKYVKENNKILEIHRGKTSLCLFLFYFLNSMLLPPPLPSNSPLSTTFTCPLRASCGLPKNWFSEC